MLQEKSQKDQTAPATALAVAMLVVSALTILASAYFTLHAKEPRATASALLVGMVVLLVLLALTRRTNASAAASSSTQVLGLCILAAGIATAAVCAFLMLGSDTTTVLTADTSQNIASAVFFSAIPVAIFGWALNRGLLSK